MTLFLVTFGDGHTETVKAENSGAARADAQDKRCREIGQIPRNASKYNTATLASVLKRWVIVDVKGIE